MANKLLLKVDIAGKSFLWDDFYEFPSRVFGKHNWLGQSNWFNLYTQLDYDQKMECVTCVQAPYFLTQR